MSDASAAPKPRVSSVGLLAAVPPQGRMAGAPSARGGGLLGHQPELSGVRVALAAGDEEVLRTRRCEHDEQPRLVAAHRQAVRDALGSAA